MPGVVGDGPHAPQCFPRVSPVVQAQGEGVQQLPLSADTLEEVRKVHARRVGHQRVRGVQHVGRLALQVVTGTQVVVTYKGSTNNGSCHCNVQVWKLKDYALTNYKIYKVMIWYLTPKIDTATWTFLGLSDMRHWL